MPRGEITVGLVAHALGFIDTPAIRPLRVALDGGNGMAGPIVGPILEQLNGLELLAFYPKPDGTFPDHEPTPCCPGTASFIMAFMTALLAEAVLEKQPAADIL